MNPILQCIIVLGTVLITFGASVLVYLKGDRDGFEMLVFLGAIIISMIVAGIVLLS